jgi:hypothetical protein
VFGGLDGVLGAIQIQIRDRLEENKDISGVLVFRATSLMAESCSKNDEFELSECALLLEDNFEANHWGNIESRLDDRSLCGTRESRGAAEDFDWRRQARAREMR